MLWKAQNWDGQHDPQHDQEVSLGMQPWPTNPAGAFAAYNVLNFADGHGRQVQSDGSCIFEVRQGDHPGSSGGDRAGMGVTGNQVKTPSGPAGSELIGQPGRELWYRLTTGFPSGVNVLPLKWHNNCSEWHGASSGPSPLCLGINGAGDHYGLVYQPTILGAQEPIHRLHDIPIVLDDFRAWDIGVLWSTDASGWVLVHLDGELVADLEGVQTMKTFQSGGTEPVAFACQLYRQRTAPDGPIPPSQLQVWPPAIADSQANLGA